VLQDRKVAPLGSGKEYEVDVMLICATNKNLKTLIAQGQFREDLYYRLNGLVVRLPALRERSDFEVVTHKILHNLCEPGQHIGISPEVMALFQRYRWPGNFRQLHNLLRTAVVMVGHSGDIGVAHLPDDFLDEVQQHLADTHLLEPLPQEDVALGIPLAQPLPSMPPSAPASMGAWHAPAAAQPVSAFAPLAAHTVTAPRLQDVALQAMTDALRQCQGNVSAAAKLLGVSRNTIYRKKDQLPSDVWD